MNLYGIFAEGDKEKELISCFVQTNNREAILSFDAFLGSCIQKEEDKNYNYELRLLGEYIKGTWTHKDVFMRLHNPRWDHFNKMSRYKVRRHQNATFENMEQVRRRVKLQKNQSELIKYIFDGEFIQGDFFNENITR